MKKFYLMLFVFIAIAMSSCHKDVMDRTIFIPDENDDKLPEYSEWGYNSFGAEYERDYFLVSNSIIPCKIMYSDNKLQFSLHGRIRSSTEEMTLVFIFPLEQISSYEDLIRLNNVKINLSNADCTVKIFKYNQEVTLNILKGNLHFKRTQLLNIDDAPNRVILSGVFDLSFLYNSFPTSISNGRFDLGIVDKIFYSND